MAKEIIEQRTHPGFCPDARLKALSDGEQELLARFEKDRCEALCWMGLEKRLDNLSPSAAFLYLLSDTFSKS